MIIPARPFETRFFQTLLPQTKTTGLPVQNLDLVTFSVAEHEQLFRKRSCSSISSTRIARPLMPLRKSTISRQRKTAGDSFDGLITSTEDAELKTAVNASTSTAPVKLTDNPFGGWICHSLPGTTLTFFARWDRAL